MEYADGAIAGTGLKQDGVVTAAVDADRVRAVRDAMTASRHD
jgi:predicted TIM-barrel enzyme